MSNFFNSKNKDLIMIRPGRIKNVVSGIDPSDVVIVSQVSSLISELQNWNNTTNTFFGYQSGLNDNKVSTNANSAFGYTALKSNVSGSVNTAFGYQALTNNTGSSNAAFGYNSGRDNTSGGNNVYVGESSGRANATGAGNVYIGKAAGLFNTGSGNVFIGLNSGRYAVGETNAFYLNNRDLSNTTTDKTNSLLYGGFNTTVSSQFLTVNGNLVGGSAALATNATGGFWYIPSCAGAPSGTPTSFTGTIPMVYDSTNNFLYIYNGGGWKKSTVYA